MVQAAIRSEPGVGSSANGSVAQVGAFPADDLKYSGRDRKRPPGASQLVQRVYGLLVGQPDGLTFEAIHDHFREGWMETDAYRAYQNHLENGSKRGATATTSTVAPRFRRAGPYGSTDFNERAQRWWLGVKLRAMASGVNPTATRSGTLWKAGARAPKAMIACDVPNKGYHVAPLDVGKAKALIGASQANSARRERVKAECLALLKRRGDTLKVSRAHVQETYDALMGR